MSRSDISGSKADHSSCVDQRFHEPPRFLDDAYAASYFLHLNPCYSRIESRHVRKPLGGARVTAAGNLIKCLLQRPRDGARLASSDRTKIRSEEHTSELQSLTNLVCRLLLEKKNRKQSRTYGCLPRCAADMILTASGT